MFLYLSWGVRMLTSLYLLCFVLGRDFDGCGGGLGRGSVDGKSFLGELLPMIVHLRSKHLVLLEVDDWLLFSMMGDTQLHVVGEVG